MVAIAPNDARKRLPEALVLSGRWLVWKSVPKPDASKKADKVPYYVSGTRRHGALDTPEDHAQLATFDDALDAYCRGGYMGLAIALGPDGSGNYWQGIDLDDIPERQLSRLANALPGYVEFSPSGKGCHALGYGKHFRTLGSNGTGTEAYAEKRFFTFTGNIIRFAELGCLADVVEQAVAPIHGASRPLEDAQSGAVSVDPSTVTELRSALFSIPSDDREVWIRMGMALREIRAGRELWLTWSATSPKFDPRDAVKTWDSFKPTSTGYQAVFAEAGRHGWVNPKSNAAQGHGQPLALGRSYQEVIRLCSAAEMANRPALRWRIHGLLPEQGLVAVYGPPGSGKSFWILDMLAAIAAGNQWCGRRIRQAPVIYAALEGRAGVTLRVRAYQQQIGSMDGVTFLESAVDIRKLEDREQLIRVIREAGIAGGVLCLDTLAASGPGMDENASAEMGAMIRHLQDLQSALGGCVIVVHHTGKDESRGLRGWSGLKGALDTSIELSRTDKGVRRWRLDKSKDGADGIEGAFSLTTVVVGRDEYGDELSSCVVTPPVVFDPSFGRDGKAYAVRDAEDDEFVYAWVKAEVAKKEYPTGRSLEGQRELQMMKTRDMTQKRLRDAINRLKAGSRLLEAKDKELHAPSGNPWLRPPE